MTKNEAIELARKAGYSITCYGIQDESITTHAVFNKFEKQIFGGSHETMKVMNLIKLAREYERAQIEAGR